MSNFMAYWRVGVVGVAALVVGLAEPGRALAQNQNGSLIGSAYDQAGMPVRGVKITISSPTQIGGTRSTTTNDEGTFRFPALQPGSFELRATAPKLKPIIVKDVKVGIAVAEVNLVLEVEGATEEVSIRQSPPMVNTKSSAIKEVIDLDLIQSMPMDDRDNPHRQLVSSVAGAVGRGVRGGKESQTVFTQDGFDMREQYPTMKTSAAYEIMSGGHGAEAPNAPGASVNLVTKSGSNRFEFEFNATADHSRLRYFLDEGEGQPNYKYVLNPTVSGPIVRDRLWFFANLETHLDKDNRSYDPAGIFPPRPHKFKMINKGMLKFTWQVSGRNQLSSLSNFDLPREYNRKDDAGVVAEAQEHRFARRLFTGLIWDSLLSDTLVFRSQVGLTYYGEHIVPALCDSDPANCNFTLQERQSVPINQEWYNSDEHKLNETYNVQLVNRIEWFLASKIFGEHAVQLRSNYLTEQEIARTSTPGNSVLQYAGPNPSKLTTYYSNDPQQDEARYGWHIQRVTWQRHIATLTDSYRPTRYLTINPSVSHIYASAGNSSGDGEGDWTVVPSVSAIWDATHDGRTALRSSYSSYADVEIETIARHKIGGRVSQACNFNPMTREFDLGCTFSGGGSRNTIGLPCGPTGTDDQGRPCREPLRIPRTHELTGGLEREITPGVALAVDGIYRKFVNQFDTRETNRRWNPSGTALETTGSFRNGKNQTISDLGTPDYKNRRYMGVTFAAKKREGRFRIQASYTWSKLDGVHDDYGDNPGQDVYLYGPLGDDHRHEIKALARFQYTSWLSSGLRYSLMSGMPYNRRFRNLVTNEFDDHRARLGSNPGTDINDPADDRDLRLPDQQSVNLQTRLDLKPLIGQQLEFYVDVLNLLATRTVTEVTQNDTSAFGLGTKRQGPFRIRLGLNYRY